MGAKAPTDEGRDAACAGHAAGPQGTPHMRRTITLAATAAALGTAAIAAGSAAGQPAGSTTHARMPAQSASVSIDARRARVPNEIGRNHQAAQDDLQAHGFFNLRERDCTGRGRLLLFDRNWRVVRQSPRPGARVSVNRAITLCSVKYSDGAPAAPPPASRPGAPAVLTSRSI